MMEAQQQQRTQMKPQANGNGHAPPSSRWGNAQNQEVRSVTQVIPPPEPLPFGSEIPIPRGLNPEFPWGLPEEEANRLTEEQVAQMHEFAQRQHQHMTQVSETDSAIAAADAAAMHVQQQQLHSPGASFEHQQQQMSQQFQQQQISQQFEQHQSMSISTQQQVTQQVQQKVQQKVVQNAAASDQNDEEDVEIVYEEVECEDGEEEGVVEYEEIIEEEEGSHQLNGSAGHQMSKQMHEAHLQDMRSQRSMSITEKDIEQVEPYMQGQMG